MSNEKTIKVATTVSRPEADDPSRGLPRRDFLKLLGGGILIAISYGEGFPFQETPGRRFGRGYPEDFNAYLHIAENGRVTCFTGKIEQGQGSMTVLPQMLAEELEVRLEAVDIVMGDTGLCPWDMGTFGSLNVRMFGPVLRQAGAEAREVLRQLASEKLGVPLDRLVAKDGVVFDRTQPDIRATYGELANGQRIEKHLAAKPALKPESALEIMGKPLARRDARVKATGEALFAGDIRMPGMVYARILRPPAHGAKLKSLDATAARAVPGARIVRDGDLVAAVHQLPDMAAKAVAALKADYETPVLDVDDRTIFQYLLKNPPEGRVVAEGGSLAEGEKTAAVHFDETYLNSYVAHAAIEPHTAIADVKPEGVTVWASSQAPFGVKDQVAEALGVPAEKVRARSPFIGGGFGGKTHNAQAVQAARLSKIVGKPVQVMWDRADVFFYDTFRPASIVKIRSGLSSTGRIVYWDYKVYYAGERSSEQFYNIPNHRTEVLGEWGGGAGSAHPFPVGAWRGPGSNSNTHARESQIDIMAARAGIDPLEFRIMNLDNPRMVRLLKAAAEKFGWTPAKAPSGRGFGLSCADYNGTYIVAMAEAGVDRSTGEVRVKRIVGAQDCGLAVNPDGTVLQIEGCLTMGLGYALTEEVHFKGRRILDLNFDTYALPRFSWLPEIGSVILDSPEVPITGVGEPSIINMGSVVANAIFDATGIRLFELPMNPDRVKAGLAALKA
jgi:nicotinate dehydrogenase subunit B